MKEIIEKLMSEASLCPSVPEQLMVSGIDPTMGTDTVKIEYVHHVPKERTFPEEDQRPCYWLHKSNGVWGRAGVYIYGEADKDGKLPGPIWICAILEIIAITSLNTSLNVPDEWGILLTWYDPDGNKKDWAMPVSLTMEKKAILARLLAGGLEIYHRKKWDVVDYICDQKTDNRVLCFDKTGWAYPSVFITPSYIIDEFNSGDIYKFYSEIRSEPIQSHGTLKGWQENVASLCLGNSRLMFAVCTAFAGPLLEPCGFTGGGFHFIGSSSIGKSLAMQMAASVVDCPDKAVITWRATDNGLEGIAARHNHGLMMLDELGQVDGKKAGEIAYMLANGTGKARANKEGAARSRLTWKLMFLSNGEIDLTDHMAGSGKRAMAGQEVRMVSIPSDAGKGLGIFECLHNASDSKQMADNVRLASSHYYGTALIPYITYIAKNWEAVAAAGKSLVDNFISMHVTIPSDGQVKRAAERFAIVAAAGEIATRAGITGWQPGDATQAAVICYKAWVNRRGGVGSQEEADIIRRLVETISKDPTRFESEAMPGSAVNRLGFIVGNEYILTTEGFREMMKGFDPMYAAKLLQDKGIIVHPIGKDLPRRELKGLGRHRCYSIRIDDLPDTN